MKYVQPYGVSDPQAPYVNGDPSIGRKGSIPPAAAFENTQREIVNAITKAGLTPTDTDLGQLWKAMQVAPWITDYAQDMGEADALVAALDPIPDQLYVGMTARIKVAHNNTGATTLDLNGLGTHAVKRGDGADLSADDLKAGYIIELVFDGTQWETVNFFGTGTGGGGTTNNYTTRIPSVVDTSTTANSIIAPFAPAITSDLLTFGLAVLVKIANNVTGATTITVNANSAKAVVWPDGSALQEDDLIAGEIAFLAYDGTRFQCIGVYPGSARRGEVTYYGSSAHAYFKVAGTYHFIVPPGVHRMWGRVTGGGQGGGTIGDGGYWGTVGGQAEGMIPVSPGDDLTLVVGAGGAAASGTVGLVGGTSSVTKASTTILSATGGGTVYPDFWTWFSANVPGYSFWGGHGTSVGPGRGTVGDVCSIGIASGIGNPMCVHRPDLEGPPGSGGYAMEVIYNQVGSLPGAMAWPGHAGMVELVY